MAPDPTRRRVMLAAAAALPLAALPVTALSGCSGLSVLGTPPPPPGDVVLLEAAIAGENVMVARYRAVLGSSPALAPVLRPLLAEHQAHLAQLRARLVIPAGSAASPSPSRGQAAPAVPAASAAAVAFLKAAEQAAAAAMLNRVARAPASLAQLFASISASEATHVPVLAVAGTAADDLPSGSTAGPAAR